MINNLISSIKANHRYADPGNFRLKQGLATITAICITTAFLLIIDKAIGTLASMHTTILGMISTLFFTVFCKGSTRKEQQLTMIACAVMGILTFILASLLPKSTWVTNGTLICMCFIVLYVRRFGTLAQSAGMFVMISFFISTMLKITAHNIESSVLILFLSFSASFLVTFYIFPSKRKSAVQDCLESFIGETSRIVSILKDTSTGIIALEPAEKEIKSASLKLRKTLLFSQELAIGLFKEQTELRSILDTLSDCQYRISMALSIAAESLFTIYRGKKLQKNNTLFCLIEKSLLTLSNLLHTTRKGNRFSELLKINLSDYFESVSNLENWLINEKEDANQVLFPTARLFFSFQRLGITVNSLLDSVDKELNKL